MNEQRINKEKVLKSLTWRFFERCGAQAVQLVISVILARLIEPEVFGSIALVSVLIAVLNVFVDSGLGNALIQKKDADEVDFSTVFIFNICFCAVLYCLLYLVAPYIALFYCNEKLSPIIRFVGLTLILAGSKNVLQAYVFRNMQFKRFFFATLGGTVGAAAIGIILACCGAGIWSIAVQQVFNVAVDTCILWATVKWRPKFTFSYKRLISLFSYGWKILAGRLLDTVYSNIRQLLIGKVYTAEDLAFYNRGKTFPDSLVTNINSAIDSVLFPTLSSAQDNKERVKMMTKRAIKTSCYVIAPMMMGLFFCADPLIRLLLTKKWMNSVLFMRIFCITYIFYPIHTANLTAVTSLGRSDMFLKLEIAKKIVGLVALAISVPISVTAMGYSLLFTSVAGQIINSWPNKKLLNYGYLEQLKDIFPGILLAVAMGLCIYPIQWLGLPDILTLCIMVTLGVVVYIGGSVLFKLESFQYLWGIIKPYFQNLIKRI